MNKSSIFSAQRSTSFQILYCALERFSKTLNRTMHGIKIGMVKIFFKVTETLTESTASQWNSSGIFFQDTIRCSSVKKFKSYCSDWMRHQRILHEESCLCRCSTTIPVDQKTTKKECLANAKLVSLYAKRFGKGQ